MDSESRWQKGRGAVPETWNVKCNLLIGSPLTSGKEVPCTWFSAIQMLAVLACWTSFCSRVNGVPLLIPIRLGNIQTWRALNVDDSGRTPQSAVQTAPLKGSAKSVVLPSRGALRQQRRGSPSSSKFPRCCQPKQESISKLIRAIINGRRSLLPSKHGSCFATSSLSRHWAQGQHRRQRRGIRSSTRLMPRSFP